MPYAHFQPTGSGVTLFRLNEIDRQVPNNKMLARMQSGNTSRLYSIHTPGRIQCCVRTAKDLSS